MDMVSETRPAEGAVATAADELHGVIACTDDVRFDQQDTPVDASTKPVGFIHYYGWMGLPMIAIFGMSSSWTMMLAITQQIPTQVANYLMDTADLDYGEFWLLPKADSHISIPATVLLVLFSIGYLGLVALMLFPDKLLPRKHSPPAKADVASVKPMNASQDPVAKKSARLSMTIPRGRARVKYEVTSPFGLLRHYYKPLLDLPKLLFQTVTLFTYLEEGFPLPVIFIYSCSLLVNWMISSYRYKGVRRDPNLVLCRLFYSFDLFFAVFAPLEVLIYAKYHFNFDREVFATREEALPPGSFDRTARLFADPTEVSLFRIAFHYLELSTVGSLLIKSALNVLSLAKWHHAVVELVHLAQSSSSSHSSVVEISTASQAIETKRRRREYVQNFIIASVFFCVGVGVFAHSIVAVVSTQHACHPYEQCKVPSYTWNVGAKHCSCIVFIDRVTRLETIAEWEDPPNTIQNLAALAYTGHLKIVQIINRQLPTFPDELRKCHHLEQLILIYTKTLSFPDWAKEFHNLAYLHVEGDLTSKALTYMPSDLFSNMPHLMFLHFGSLVKLPAIPDFSHLDRLEYLVLAMLHSVSEIPSLDKLTELRTLRVIDLIGVYSLPSVHTLHKLNTFALINRNPVCCNGFIAPPCNLSHFSCLDRTAQGEPLVQCTTERITAEDYRVLTSTDGQVCEKNQTMDLKNIKPTVASADQACGGVVYKQCTMNGATGMCFPARMQPVSCQRAVGYTNMRRLQIQRGVGDPCDATVESWLGCTL